MTLLQQLSLSSMATVLENYWTRYGPLFAAALYMGTALNMFNCHCTLTHSTDSKAVPLQTAALKNLGLNIRRAKIKKTQDEKLVINKFYITDAVTSEKVLRSSRLEEIRATIFSNLLYYHPEAQDGMAWGQKAHKPSTADPLRPLGPRKR